MATTPNLPTPDFTFDPDVPGACIAGVRPYRNGSYRLEVDPAASKFIVHNYGHGGAGITLSWGCAAKVRDIVRTHLAASHDTNVAVLGAGVMGLTAATLLRDLGLNVTIYSERQPAETTSSKAGGQWAVSVVEFTGKEQELGEIIRTAYTTFKNSIGKGFGVSERPNYTATRSHNLDIVLKLAPGLIPKPVPLSRMPFEGHTGPGWEYQTLLIEPPIFLPHLEKDLRARGVTFISKRFASKSEVLAALTENIVINPRCDDTVERPQDDSHQGSIGNASAPTQPAISLWPERVHVSACRPRRHRRDIRERREQRDRQQGRLQGPRQSHCVAIRQGAGQAAARHPYPPSGPCTDRQSSRDGSLSSFRQKPCKHDRE
jgi:hypothetical protein